MTPTASILFSILGLLAIVAAQEDDVNKPCCVVYGKTEEDVWRVNCGPDSANYEKDKKAAGFATVPIACLDVLTDSINPTTTINIHGAYIEPKPWTSPYPNTMLGPKCFAGSPYTSFVNQEGTFVNGLDADAFDGSKVQKVAFENIYDENQENQPRAIDKNAFRQTTPTITQLDLQLDYPTTALDENIFQPMSALEKISFFHANQELTCPYLKNLPALKEIGLKDYMGNKPSTKTISQKASKCFMCALTASTKTICKMSLDLQPWENTIKNVTKEPMVNADGATCYELKDGVSSFSDAQYCKTSLCTTECKIVATEAPAVVPGGNSGSTDGDGSVVVPNSGNSTGTAAGATDPNTGAASVSAFLPLLLSAVAAALLCRS